MKPATKEESIKVIKQMLRSRCRKKGITPNEKWLNDKALELYEQDKDAIKKVEE